VLLICLAVACQQPVVDWTVAEGAVSQPQVAVSVHEGKPSFHVAFARDGRQVALRTLDASGSGSKEVLLAGAVTQAGMRRGPRIAATPTGICVSTIVYDRKIKLEGDLRSWVSDDGGRSVTGPFPISDQPGVAREGLHDMARSASGQLACVWLDLRRGAMDVYASFSSDGGRSWTPNLLVYQSPEKSVCECCAPSALFDDKNRLHVLFRNSLAGQRDMWLARGTAQGFEPAVKLGQGSWTLAGCPMAPGALALQPGAPLTIWSREDKIFRCVLGGLEEPLAQGRELAAASGAGGAWAAWIEGGAEGRLQLLVPGATTARLLASRAHWPAFSAAPEALIPLALAWEEQGEGRTAIKLRVLLPE
jgi:hypothetical protein